MISSQWPCSEQANSALGWNLPESLLWDNHFPVVVTQLDTVCMCLVPPFININT